MRGIGKDGLCWDQCYDAVSREEYNKRYLKHFVTFSLGEAIRELLAGVICFWARPCAGSWGITDK